MYSYCDNSCYALTHLVRNRELSPTSSGEIAHSCSRGDGHESGWSASHSGPVMKWPQHLCHWRACAPLRPVRASVPHDSGIECAYHTATFPGARRVCPARRFLRHPSSLAAAGSSVSGRAGPHSCCLPVVGGFGSIVGIERRVCQPRRVVPFASSSFSVPPDSVPPPRRCVLGPVVLDSLSV
jgi:hypothetical protein